MAHTMPGVFKGQVRGVSHQGQEETLHLKAEYIDADFLHPNTFPLQSDGGPYIRQVHTDTSGSHLKPCCGSVPLYVSQNPKLCVNLQPLNLSRFISPSLSKNPTFCVQNLRFSVRVIG
jgi:hypothetical protein